MTSPFVFRSEALPSVDLVVRSLEGRERLSGLFELRVEVQALEDRQLVEDSLDALLSKPANYGRRGAPPVVHGIVSEVELLVATPADPPAYRLTMVPRLWRATRTSRCRIFQDKTVPEIVQAVLQSLEFTSDDYTLQLGETYAKREYVVQYEESDYDFIARLCEGEGIFYRFEHGDGRDRVIFADANVAARELPAHEGVGYVHGSGALGFALTRLGRRTRRVQERVELLDYNWRTPALVLASSKEVAGGTTGVWTDTDEHYRDKLTGDRLARIRAEEVAATRVVYEGGSNLESLRPGDALDVHGHLVGSLDGKYLVSEVRTEVRQGDARGVEDREGISFRNQLVAIEFLTPYRPARATSMPRISGVVYATIDGPDLGAAAPIDAQGRYKVILPFDTSLQGTGKATRWVRMAQPLSGVGFGMHFPLRVGAEVMLVHVNGDPDRPVIAGTIPNALTVSPVTQKNATQSVIQTHAGIRVELEDHAT